MAILPHYNGNIKKLKKYIKPKKIHSGKKYFKIFGKNILWFTTGAILGLFFFISFLYIAYKGVHENKIYDGVLVDNVNFSGKGPDVIANYFNEKNKTVQKTIITLHSENLTATISAKQINFGYDSNLLANQAMTVGRSSDNLLTNMSLLLQAYINTVDLPPAFHYSDEKLDAIIAAINKKADVEPINPLFNIVNGRAVTFQLGTDGKQLDEDALKASILKEFQDSVLNSNPEKIALTMPIKTLFAASAANEANRLGIKEEIAEGSSEYQGSSPERAFNIALAASRINGAIIKPGAIFSFDQAVGDISSLTGYEQAYVIENGHTVLGDGGGVCQVSTTMFRAALNAGLEITERHQHAYRVGYYEQDSGPGIDAAIYYPTVDLKFKNNTGHSILIQTQNDPDNEQLTFIFYGTKNPNRQVSISTPVVLSQTPAPPPLYQDDPSLPAGQIQQIDFSANGADVYFTRTVTENGKVILYDKFTSDYQPWQAVYNRGTQT